MSRVSGNNPHLAKNSGGLPHYQFRIKNRIWVDFNWIIFTSVINNYILSFSSFLNKVKVKMKGFSKLHGPDGGHVGCGIW